MRNRWIGLRDTGIISIGFAWIDGSTANYTSWYARHPAAGMPYTALYRTGEWLSEIGSESYGFICKKGKLISGRVAC